MTGELATRSAFERDILWILANGGKQPGVEIRNTLMEYYNRPVNHGQLYPNLDELVDAGLISKGKIDGRTNSYSLTEAGRRALSHRQAWEAGNGTNQEQPSRTT